MWGRVAAVENRLPVSQEQQEMDWSIELHWVEPERIDFELVPLSQPLPESPSLQVFRQAVALCDEGDWEQGVSAYEGVLGQLSPHETLLAQLASWGRSSALQQLGRHQEAWDGLALLLSPGRRWQTPVSLMLNWLQTSILVAAQTKQGQAAATLLHLCYALSTSYPQLDLSQRFGELLIEAYEALAGEDLEAAVDWLDVTRLEWESDDWVLPSVRFLLVDGLVELLEFEGALEEAEEVVSWAARQGDDELVAEWSERVEDLREQARDPYNLARRDDRRGLARLGKVNHLGKSGRNALMGAAVTNNLDMAVWLLERNANPNLMGSDGWNPVLLAADHDHVEMVSLLAQWRADLGATNDLDQNCLHVAAWQDYQDTARRLIELGIEVDYCDSSGNTALHLAASEPVPAMIELLASVLPVDVRNDCTESTPLMLAAESDLVENLETLLRLGADPEARDLRGKRALDYAKFNEADEAARFLLNLKGRGRS
ncbi:ankyrin repeat domain-containing protein [bacterium]|nr:ankyrin repeat domain-containing protein [bacterium]